MHMDMSQEPCYAKFTREETDAPTATPVLCQLAQSKCTWTCHESNFTRKFAGKMPDAPTAAPVLCELAQSKCTWQDMLYGGLLVCFDFVLFSVVPMGHVLWRYAAMMSCCCASMLALRHVVWSCLVSCGVVMLHDI